MKISINVKPTKYTASSKRSCLLKAGLRGWVSGYRRNCSYSVYNNGMFYNDGSILVMTCQKYRRKVVDGVYHPTRWEMYVYKLPISWLELARLNVVQKSRTFELKPSK